MFIFCECIYSHPYSTVVAILIEVFSQRYCVIWLVLLWSMFEKVLREGLRYWCFLSNIFQCMQCNFFPLKRQVVISFHFWTVQSRLLKLALVVLHDMSTIYHLPYCFLVFLECCVNTVFMFTTLEYLTLIWYLEMFRNLISCFVSSIQNQFVLILLWAHCCLSA